MLIRQLEFQDLYHYTNNYVINFRDSEVSLSMLRAKNQIVILTGNGDLLTINAEKKHYSKTRKIRNYFQCLNVHIMTSVIFNA